MDCLMTIGQLEARSSVPASTIRYWERIGVFPHAARVNGRRRYSTDAVYLLAVLQLAQSCGFRLPEMRRLFRGFPPDVAVSRRWRELAGKKLVELDDQMAQLKAMKRLIGRVLRCQCIDLVECGRRSAASARKEAPRT
jgi:MerR family redox-sensitive transcriptional activator SoxR